jgi:uncharacterized protein (UPF0276 family)
MTEQIEFNLDAEYTARVAQIPGLVEIDFSVYEEWELDEENEKVKEWRAHERQQLTEEIEKL